MHLLFQAQIRTKLKWRHFTHVPPFSQTLLTHGLGICLHSTTQCQWDASAVKDTCCQSLVTVDQSLMVVLNTCFPANSTVWDGYEVLMKELCQWGRAWGFIACPPPPPHYSHCAVWAGTQCDLPFPASVTMPSLLVLSCLLCHDGFYSSETTDSFSLKLSTSGHFITATEKKLTDKWY